MNRAVLGSVILILVTACGGGGSVEVTADGVVLRPAMAGAAPVRVRALQPGIFQVTAAPNGDFERAASLMRDNSTLSTAFTVEEAEDAVSLITARGSARIERASGAVSFFDAAGAELLAERGVREFDAFELDGNTRYSVRQRFAPGPEDAFYGLGQHQNGQFNYRGQTVELAQHNISIAVPFLASTGGYGILWDNNSITRFGDPRPFAALDEGFVVRASDGTEGGLEGRYYRGDDVLVTLRESDPDFEFLEPDQYLKGSGTRAVWPQPFVDKSPDKVVWSGTIEAREAGRHTFRVYASHYVKVRIDGELVVDRWRQNWNPYYFLFEREMTPGTRHAIDIEWLPNDGYFRIGHLGPPPRGEADDVSLWSEAAEVIDYYFVAGETLDEVIGGYRRLTGKATLLPNWAFGFWQSRQRYKTQRELLDVVAEYRRRGIPIDNIVQDWFYWREDDWGSHAFDPERFPDPKAMVNEVHGMNARIMISVWPKFYPTTGHFDELADLGAVYRRNLDMQTRDWVGPGYRSTFYDPYSAAARRVYWRQMQETLDVLGFDAWWMDATEPDIHSNLSHTERKRRMGPTALGPADDYFNTYGLMNAMAVYEGERAGSDADRRVFILTRSGFAGQQRYAAATWSGDIVARWDDLKEQIAAGLNMTLSGLPNWTFDIGGFAVEDRYSEMDADHLEEWRELNLRWFQFGAFAPLFRSHGEFPYREVFNLAEEGSEVYESLVYYDKLRYRLLPYLCSVAAATWHSDGSIARPMVMDFADDETTHDIGDQYLFGPSLLVAPVYEYGARERRVYLPRGASWYDMETGERFSGGEWLDAPAPLARMPIYVRAGAIVPTGPAAQYAAQALNTDLTLLVYPGADGRFSLFEDDGTTYAYERGGFSRIDMTYEDATGSLSLSAREGTFDGMAPTRRIVVRWMGDAPAETSVRYSGDALRVTRP